MITQTAVAMLRTCHVLLGLAGLALAPGSAIAAQVSSFDDWNPDQVFSRDRVVYTAAQGEVNDVSVSVADGRYVIFDPGATIEPGQGCRLTDGTGHRAECDTYERLGAEVDLGDGDDRALATLPHGIAKPVRHAVELDGGAGDDRLTGGESPDLLRGGDGDDLLLGNGHQDVIDGGAGADRLEGGDDDAKTYYVFDPPGTGTDPLPGVGDELDGGTGPDVISGGPGIVDEVSYSGRVAGVRASPGVLPDDGEPGEGDLVMDDVERLTGGRGDDTLIGTPGFNGFVAGHGDDVVFGGGGFHDFSFGGPGDDTFYLRDGEPEGSGARGVLHGTFYDDTFDCGDYDLESTAPGVDTVLADYGDSAALTAQLRGCEVVLFTDAGIRIGPDTPSVVTEIACPVTSPIAECTGLAELRVPEPGLSKSARAPGRFRFPRAWRELGEKSFKARRKGRRIRVVLTSKGRRFVRRHGAVRAYPTVRFRKVRLGTVP